MITYVQSDIYILQVIIQQEFRKIDKLFGDELDFEDIKFPVRIKDIHKIEKNYYIGISVFGYIIKEKYLLCVNKCFQKTC